MGITGTKWSTIYQICVKNDNNNFKLGKIVGTIDGIAGKDKTLLITDINIAGEPYHVIRFYTNRINYRRIVKRVAYYYPDLFISDKK